ncbi:MAG TPA: SDR family oxidoreductase [Acidimicrobiales bacterium]
MTMNKVVVITGASQGIGAGLVRAYKELGFDVVANSRSITASSEAGVETVAGDIGDPAVAEHLIDTALVKFGRVDTLVNNAGVFLAKPFVDYTQHEYDLVLRTNVAGFFHVTQRAARRMLDSGEGGHIVNVTTSLVESALSALPAALASLTKGGLAAVTKALAVEFATSGIRVNAVAPGVIKTPMHHESTHEFLKGLHPMNELGEIEDVVRGVLYLEESPFVTGEFLHVDGGWSAGH